MVVHRVLVGLTRPCAVIKGLRPSHRFNPGNPQRLRGFVVEPAFGAPAALGLLSVVADPRFPEALPGDSSVALPERLDAAAAPAFPVTPELPLCSAVAVAGSVVHDIGCTFCKCPVRLWGPPSGPVPSMSTPSAGTGTGTGMAGVKYTGERGAGSNGLSAF